MTLWSANISLFKVKDTQACSHALQYTKSQASMIISLLFIAIIRWLYYTELYSGT